MWAARAVGLGLLLAACSGGYPLPPTRCDEWCDATKFDGCSRSYDPAGCVATCENSGYASHCGKALDALTACYRRNPDAATLRCTATNDVECRAEVEEFGLCVGVIDIAGGPIE